MKELAGNPGKRAINNKEPKPKSAVPQCPRHLKGDAKTEWKRVTKELHAIGVLARIDRAVLVAYCTAWGDLVNAEAQIEEEGAVIVSDKGGMYQNPWVAIKKRSMDQIVKYAAEFGMTPSSRSRLKVELPGEEDEMASLLFGTKAKVTK
jgi:P27 family predicted phage terminase small subunit